MPAKKEQQKRRCQSEEKYTKKKLFEVEFLISHQMSRIGVDSPAPSYVDFKSELYPTQIERTNDMKRITNI